MEFIKTVKGIVLAIIFITLAIMSPLIAKLTPEILKLASDDATQEVMDVLAAMIPDPTAQSSYEQFFGNFNQIGLLALIIVFAGIVANEKSKNTAAYILTKNISRAQFILSKFAASVVFTFVSVIITMGVQMLYTNMLFDDYNTIPAKNILLFSALLLLYLVFILSIVIFSSVVTKTVTSATFVAFLIFITFNLATIIPKIGKYMPPEVNNFGVLIQTKSIGDLAVNIIVTALCSVIFIIASLELFNRQEL